MAPIREDQTYKAGDIVRLKYPERPMWDSLFRGLPRIRNGTFRVTHVYSQGDVEITRKTRKVRFTAVVPAVTLEKADPSLTIILVAGFIALILMLALANRFYQNSIVAACAFTVILALCLVIIIRRMLAFCR